MYINGEIEEHAQGPKLWFSVGYQPVYIHVGHLIPCFIKCNSWPFDQLRWYMYDSVKLWTWMFEA